MITERREHGVWKTGLWFIFKYFERSSLGDTFHFVTLPDSDSYSDSFSIELSPEEFSNIKPFSVSVTEVTENSTSFIPFIFTAYLFLFFLPRN